MKILIGTPAYNGQIHINYLNSIMSFYKNKINFTVMNIGNESLIPRGRNTIISLFSQLKEYDYLLFLDADIFLDGKDLKKLLNYNKDVISAPVPLKGFDSKGNKVYNVGKLLEREDELCVIDRVGTAVLLLSRFAVEELVEDAKKNDNVYEPNPHTRSSMKTDKMYDIFKTGVKDGVYLSEDFFVCDKLIELGFKIYCDDKIVVKHAGMVEF